MQQHYCCNNAITHSVFSRIADLSHLHAVTVRCEQAFAKAHGSYHAISGGYTKDAFTALTGAPTEVLLLDGTSFDSERAWLRLLSFAESRFPMVIFLLLSNLIRHMKLHADNASCKRSCAFTSSASARLYYCKRQLHGAVAV
jgi:Calpain family cysteine protease